MKRWFIIRHFRWLWLSSRLWLYWDGFARHYWLTLNPADLRYLDDVWKGKR